MGCLCSKCCPGAEKDSNGLAVRRNGHSVQTDQPQNATPIRSQPTGPKFSSFENLCLAEHNRVRVKHGCPPLELDRNMCNFSAEWARNIGNRNLIEHRPNNKYGENIYWASGKEVDGKDAVVSWYEEIKDYRFGSGGFSMSTGHFTQVVWKSSKKLGVGIERRGNSTWIVANYDPPGNYSGQYEENVPSARY